MEREIVFSNKSLNYKNILKLKEIIDGNENIDSVKIYTVRNIKQKRIKIRDCQSFDNINSFIEYLDLKQISKLESIEIKFFFKNRNSACLMYDDFPCNWILKYDNQDFNVDSIIYNLNDMIKDNVFRKYRKYRSLIIISLASCGLIYSIFATNHLITYVILFLFLLLEVDSIFFKNLAYKENNFISKNKDSIFLSALFYVLGVITPYIIEFVVNLFK